MNDGGSIIDSQNQVGGWPDLQTPPSPLDSDQDGIPDEWEIAHGLDPFDPADGSALTESGYTNLEIYLNELVTPTI
jgi:hypothetical protein